MLKHHDFTAVHPPPAPPPETATGDVTEFEANFYSEDVKTDQFQDLVSFPADDIVVNSFPKVHRTLNATESVSGATSGEDIILPHTYFL